MPAIDALSLFYDFRDLTPVGRRGDEMIRKLADRLVSVDLLDQARRAAAASGRQPPARRRARAGRGAARGDLSDGAQAGPRHPGAARKPQRRPADRNARSAADDRGARAIRRRPAGTGAGSDRERARPRGGAPARRHDVEGAALARRGRAGREVLRRALARVRAAERDRARRHSARRRSVTRSPRTRSGSIGCATSMRRRWPRGRTAARSTW